MADWTREFSDESLIKALREMHDETDVMKPFTRTIFSDAADQIAEYSNWKSGKIGVQEHLALIEENKRLKAEISEMRERDRWIPVVEKLPEESGKYLARINRTAIDELGGNSDFVRIKMFMGGEWAYGTHIPAWINGQLKDTVTHWRPLPSTETKGDD